MRDWISFDEAKYDLVQKRPSRRGDSNRPAYSLDSLKRYDLIFRTAHLHQITLAREILEQAAIPHEADEELVSGLPTAIGVEAAPGPGVAWSIRVDPNCKEEAVEELENVGLDVSTDFPEVWASARNDKAIRMIRWFLIGTALLILLLWLTEIFAY